jgi:6-phosphogluconolactonase
VVLPDPAVLAAAAAARLITRLIDVQAHRGTASVVLAGGGVAVATLRAVRESPAVRAVDWSRVDVWWGDERWVEADSPDRNERQAREALLDHLPLDPARVHPMGSLSDTASPEEAAELYAAELSRCAPADRDVPAFDVLLLGMGAEGHTASIFPGSPATHSEEPVVGVHGCPKPPPLRVSLGFAALTAAEEVWMLVCGAEKAAAVALALSGAGRVQCPAAGPVGLHQTLWLLDEAAAGQLPRDLRRR